VGLDVRALLVACLVFTGCHFVRPTVEQAEIQATVRLVSSEGSCSGVAVAKNSILTAGHCYSETPIRVYNSTGDYRCIGTSVKVDEAADLMLLHTSCELPVTARIAPYEPLQGTRVQVSGYPLGIDLPVMTEGFLTAISGRKGMSFNKQVLSAPTIGGNSGGPVWLDGQVVGIVSCGHQDYHHLNFVVRQPVISKFLMIQ